MPETPNADYAPMHFTRREPSCVHSRPFYQPMSACIECQHHPVLAAWRRYWAEKNTHPDAPGDTDA